jgi:outer membrane protein OmpA-like peptidoglycan-associated protein
MAATSHSDDTSDIFWPGYVDAVTNLAINLLFVIAVMSIVVLAAILQISELSKRKSVEGETSTHNSAPASSDFTLAQLEEKLQIAQVNLQSTQAKLVEVEKKLKQKDMSDTRESRTETISVAATKQTANSDVNGVHAIGGGVIVNFATDAITLSHSETSELISKLNTFGTVKTTRWQVAVISPKGFSEALRLSYYRANAVRNALIENGTPSNAIEIKITESTQAGANNAKVLVRVQP